MYVICMAIKEIIEFRLYPTQTRIGAQCYKYTGRSDAYFFIHVQGPLEDSHFQTQLANTLDKRIC